MTTILTCIDAQSFRLYCRTGYNQLHFSGPSAAALRIEFVVGAQGFRTNPTALKAGECSYLDSAPAANFPHTLFYQMSSGVTVNIDHVASSTPSSISTSDPIASGFALMATTTGTILLFTGHEYHPPQTNPWVVNLAYQLIIDQYLGVVTSVPTPPSGGGGGGGIDCITSVGVSGLRACRSTNLDESEPVVVQSIATADQTYTSDQMIQAASSSNITAASTIFAAWFIGGLVAGIMIVVMTHGIVAWKRSRNSNIVTTTHVQLDTTTPNTNTPVAPTMDMRV